MTAAFANIRRLLLGNGLAQALQFASIAVLSRIYQPHDFGLLAQVQSIATVAAIVVTLQLHLTIPLSRDAGEARSIAAQVQVLCLLLAGATLPLALWLGKVALFTVVLTACLGMSNTCTAYLVYQGHFGSLSGFYVKRALFVILMQIGFALVAINDGLVWATVIGEGAAAAYLRLVHVGRIDARAGVRDALALASRLTAFSIFGTLQELVSVSAFYAPLLLFTRLFGDGVGGQYAMASRLVWAPVIVLSGSVAQVLYHRFGQVPPDRAARVWDLGAGRLVVASTLLACGLSFYLKDVFILALGPQWELASHLLPLQLLWGCIFLLSTPFRVACRVLHLQKVQLWIDAGMLAAIATAFAFMDLSPLHLMWAVVLIALVQNGALAAAISASLGRGVSKVHP